MKREDKNSGFSLVELIIVIAIMAVLIGIMAPMYMKYRVQAQKEVCNTNRKTLEDQFLYDQASGMYRTKEEAEKMVEQSDVHCPSGGTYTILYYEGSSPRIKILCSEHEPEEEISSNAVSQGLWKDFMNFANDSGETNNDKLRRAFYESRGGQWPVLKVGGRDFYIQPYYSAKADQSLPIDQRTWLFARSTSGSGAGWNVSYVFDPVDKKWYGATYYNGTAGNTGAFQINGDAASIHNQLLNDTHSNGNKKWIALEEGAYEEAEK